MKAATPAVADVAAAGAAVAPPAPAAPPAPPAPSPQYTPPPAPMPSMAEGGDVGAAPARKNPFKDFFADVNVVDVAISAFIVGAVIYSIQYHKFMIMMEKTGYADLSTRINRVENDIATAKRKASEANASGSMKMRRKRALVTL
ncbi:MAG: hypothetical protein FJY17_00055 [Bacteroidetes bacterium]|nr:hypothetical protein [Bacteroidota bacterium]